MKLSIMWNYTLYSLTKLNSAAPGVEGETWLDLGCSCHGGAEQLGQKSRAFYEILVPCWCCCQGRLQGIERNRLKEVKALVLLLQVSTFSFFSHFSLSFIVCISSVQFTFDKPQHTYLRTSVYLATAPEVIFFCLLREGNFPQSLLAQLPAAALLPFIINQESSRGIFFAKRGPEWTEKGLRSGQISKLRWVPWHSEG